MLYQFSLEQDAPSAELLEKFTQQYPEYAEALTDFAIKWAADTIAMPALIADESESTDDVSVSIAMSQFLNKTHELKSLNATKTSSQANIVRNPFSTLEKAETFVNSAKYKTDHEMNIHYSQKVNLHVVQLSPFRTRAKADEVRDELRKITEFSGAFIVPNNK